MDFHNKFQFIGFNSIRGRYLYAALIFGVYLIAVAWFADSKVNTVLETTNANAVQHQRILDVIQQVTSDIWNLQNHIQSYLLSPGQNQQNVIRNTFKVIDGDVSGLDKLLHTSASQRAEDAVINLEKKLINLRTDVNKLLDIRTDPNKLFPAGIILREKMLPAHNGFISAVTVALEDAEDTFSTPQKKEVYQLLENIRYNWIQMIVAFRVYVANRSGIFSSNPKQGMEAQAKNISLFSHEIRKQLDQLSGYEKKGWLEFQQIESLQLMHRFNTQWQEAFQKAANIYVSASWRTDEPMIKDSIQPLFISIWNTIRVISRFNDVSTSNDMTNLSTIADQLSNFYWIMTFAGIVLTILGYVFFELLVNKPVSRVARALKAEAEGHSDIILKKGSTVETNHLIEAFGQMRRQVYIRQQRLEAILDNAAEGIITIDEFGKIESFNAAAVRLFGYETDEVIGKNISILMPQPHRDKHDDYLRQYLQSRKSLILGKERELLGQRKDQTAFPISLKVSEIYLEGKRLFVGLIADISERKAIMDHLQNVAEHDGLTGLSNRHYFQQELEKAVSNANMPKGPPFTLLYIDLDNFKYVNDTLGHAAGDFLLIEIAKLMNNSFRRRDTIARFGGDEFTVLLIDTEANAAVQVAENFRKKLTEEVFMYAGKQIHASCCIGIAGNTFGISSFEEVLSQSDLACHLAKRSGRNRVHLFNRNNEMDMTAMSLEMGWSQRIKDAIEQGNFVLASQPIINTKTQEIESHEVLIRMIDENDQHLLPGGFLPSAERFGLAADIDKWVIVNAIETLMEQRKITPKLRYSINLSGQSLSDTTVCDLIKQKILETGLDPAALTFEVTETMAIADMQAAELILAELKQLGCRTALDDFGTGMSSFAYLKDLPVDIVKIDGRFVKHLAENPVDQAMIKAMNEVAHALGKQTVAEFVENEASYKFLADIGVDYVQGYYIGKPQIVLSKKFEYKFCPVSLASNSQ